MRIATWNVNSLKARLEAVEKWLERAEPDVLLMQETKLADDDGPRDAVPDGGLRARPPRRGALERRRDREPAAASTTWSSRTSATGRSGTAGARTAAAADEEDFDPFDEARMVSAVCGGIRFVSLYAPNGRVVGTRSVRGQAALVRAVARAGWTRPA